MRADTVACGAWGVHKHSLTGTLLPAQCMGENKGGEGDEEGPVREKPQSISGDCNEPLSVFNEETQVQVSPASEYDTERRGLDCSR